MAVGPFSENNRAQHSVPHDHRDNNAREPRKNAGAGVVGLPLCGVRVFKQVSWLEVDSVKAVLPRPAHQPPAGMLRDG